MCLLKTISREDYLKNKFPKVKIAKKDIRVYKALEVIIKDKKYYKSPFQSFMYEEGYHYSEDSLVPEAWKISDYFKADYYMRVEKGFHAFTTLLEAECQWEDDDTIIIVEMTIPAGAEYYKGEANDIVSTELIWYEGAKTYTV